MCLSVHPSWNALRITSVSAGARKESHLLLNGLHDTEHTFGARLTWLRISLEDFLRRPWVNTHFAFVLPFGGFLLKS